MIGLQAILNMSDTNRLIRQMQNSKGSSIAEGSQRSIIAHAPSRFSMSEGEQVYAQEANKQLALYKKNKGLLHKVNLSSDGNQHIEKDLFIKGNLYTDKRIYGNQVSWYSHNFNYTGTDKVYFGWNRAAGTTSQEVYSKLIAPYKGKLLNVLVRTESVGASSIVGFHKATDTTTDPSATATEAITVNMSAADTTYDFKFTQAAKFNKGDVISLSIDATNAVNDLNATSIFLFEINL